LWKPRAPRRKADFPIGILGFGVLGEHVARSLQALGFPVHAWTRTPREDIDVDLFSGEAALDDFLAATRILVCLLPLTAETRGIVDRRTLGLLRPDAYVINVAPTTAALPAPPSMSSGPSRCRHRARSGITRRSP
jgi:glyoxylate/hydroxypyruvate reductase